MGVGCVVRDDSGSFLRARTNMVRGCLFVKETEALSLMEALPWMKTWRINEVIFQSDTKLLVDAFKGNQKRLISDTLIKYYKELFKHFNKVLIVFEVVP